MATKWKSIVRQIILWAAVAAIMVTTALSLQELIKIVEVEKSLEGDNSVYIYNVDEDLLKNQEFKDSRAYQRFCDQYVGDYFEYFMEKSGEVKPSGHKYAADEDSGYLSDATVTAKLTYNKKSNKKAKTFDYNKGKYEANDSVPGTIYAKAVLEASEGSTWDDDKQKEITYTDYFLEAEQYTDDSYDHAKLDGHGYSVNLGSTSDKNFKKPDVKELTMTIVINPEVIRSVEDNYHTWNRTMHSARGKAELYLSIMAVSVILMLICASPKDRFGFGRWMDRMFLEIHWALLIGFTGASFGAAAMTLASFDEGLIDTIQQLGYAGMLAFELAGLYMIISGIRKLKDHYYFRSSIVYKLLAGTGNAIKKQTEQWNELRSKEASTLRIREQELKKKRHTLILLVILDAIVAFGLLCLIDYDGVFFAFCVIFVIAAGFIFLRFFRDYKRSIQDMLDFEKVLLQIDEIAGGDLDAKTDLSEESLYYAATRNLEGIGQGLENSMKEQLKSERMKIDLITNVSHDLKTPLTSIIGYIDLLSKDETLSEESRDYVTILEKKSDRLRHIVTDLFDLAKTTSGNANVSLRNIELRRLVEQTLAEMGDVIEESGFEIVENYESENSEICADADRMYRVIQNIMDNALKYSLKGSRIFVNIKDDSDNKIKLEVLNTASYHMNFSDEEIMERFRRGDEARSSEGSGLGLSIAESFTKLCGGVLQVHTHGDQFAVEIVFEKI